jgi:hypothetical protein
VDGLVELAGADVLGGGVLVPGELDVAGRMAVLRHRFAGGGGDDDDDSDDTRLEPKRGSQIWEGKQTRLLLGYLIMIKCPTLLCHLPQKAHLFWLRWNAPFYFACLIKCPI